MKNQKALVLVLIAILIFSSIVVTGCRKESTTSEKTGTLQIAAVAPFEDQYFNIWFEGARAAAKKLNVKLSEATAGWDPNKQNNLIEAAVAAGAKGVLVARVDLDAFVPLSQKLTQQGIAVVTTDGPVHTGPRLAHLSSDDMKVGQAIGKALLEGLEKSGKPKPWKIVAFAGLPGTYAGMVRIEGALSILNPLIQKGEIKLVSTEIANFDRELGMKKMEAILARTHEIDGIFGANDDMVLGAAKACENAGLKPGKDVILVGVDVIPDAQQAIRDEKMYASISQAPYLEGYWGTCILYFNLTTGCKPDSIELPIPIITVTKQNVNDFEREVKFDQPPSKEWFTNCKDKYEEFVKKFWETK